MFNFRKNKIVKKWEGKSVEELKDFVYKNFPALAWERIYVRIYDKVKDTSVLNSEAIIMINELLKRFYGQKLK